MLRTSSYTIYVDLPDSRDEMLVVHGYTGAYDRVSRRVANYLRSLESKRPPKPLYGEWLSEPDLPEEVSTPGEDTLKLLESRGYLTKLDREKEKEFFGRLALKLAERSAQMPPSYIFMPTYSCNLRCPYCFQDHMRTDSSYRHLLKTMSREMVDRYFKAMPRIEALHGIEAAPDHERSIGFFGGEPLLAANRPIVEYIMEKARSIGQASFWAVSNATELQAYDGLIGPEHINQIQITLDGPPDEHDQRRIYPDGSGSFDKIARNIDFALERGVMISVRLNIDRNNIGDLPRLAETVASHGWQDQRNFNIYTAPINASNEKTDRKTTFNSWELDKALTEMREQHPVTHFIGRPDEGIRARARQLFDQKDLIPNLRPHFCRAHDGMYILDAFGDLYACWEKTGDKKIRIGHVDESSEVHLNVPIQQEWRTRSVTSNPVCKQCRYALHCGGGCAVLALGQRGTIHANFCDGFASRFRASIAEAYMGFRDGDEAAEVLEKPCDL